SGPPPLRVRRDDGVAPRHRRRARHPDLGQALILGTGLIGAPVGAGLTGRGWHVAGWDPDRAALAEAVGVGAVSGVASDPFAAAGEVAFVVLWGRSAARTECLERLGTDARVTDVAGVRVPVVRAARHLARFVGGHPMAGRESSGPGSASAA